MPKSSDHQENSYRETIHTPTSEHSGENATPNLTTGQNTDPITESAAAAMDPHPQTYGPTQQTHQAHMDWLATGPAATQGLVEQQPVQADDGVEASNDSVFDLSRTNLFSLKSVGLIKVNAPAVPALHGKRAHNYLVLLAPG